MNRDKTKLNLNFCYAQRDFGFISVEREQEEQGNFVKKKKNNNECKYIASRKGG
jgi:hypothetical protein